MFGNLRVLVASAIMVVSMVAKADDYVLKVGENILKEYASANATFTAESDCKVVLEAQETFTVSYDGKKYDNGYVPGSDFAYTYEIDGVKAGTVVTVSSDFVMNTKSTIVVKVFESGQRVPITIKDMVPEQGNAFSWHTSGNVTVNFNRAITMNLIKLVCGAYSFDVDDILLSGNSLSFNITSALNAALSDGKIKAGDKFQIRISGLRDAKDDANLYEGSGRLVIEFDAPYRQNTFVKATVAGSQLSYITANSYNFLSYYRPDSEDGLIEVEFSGDIKSVDDVYLSMGNLDLDASGKYHRSSLPYTINGNKLIIDARGKLRTLAVLFPAVVETEPGEDGGNNEDLGAYDKEHATIALSNVIDVNGNAFISELPGSVGSYAFYMNYVEIVDEAYIDGDNKYEGDNVAAGEQVSLWLSNTDIQFEGLEVTYFVPSDTQDENSEIKQVQMMKIVEQYTEKSDEVQGKIISFVMPDMDNVVVGSTVRVALHNANSADGMPHYLYIEYKAVDAAVAISSVENEKSDNSVYSLNGVKANAVGKGGIYIINGKKVVRM